MTIRRLMSCVAVASAAVLACLCTAKAETVEQFYKGKTIHVIIGYGPGGGYDIYGRLAAEFLGRHIPGHPTLLPENMPGGSSLRAIEYLENVAPKDGTYLGSVQQAMALTSITGKHIHYDPSKFNYIGRFTSNIDVAVALPKSGITSIEQLRKRAAVVGADQAGSMAFAYAKWLNAYAGTKLKIVTGYTGAKQIALALERGEVDVNGSYSLPAVLTSHPGWLKGEGAAILYQNALQRFPQLPNVPTLLDLAQDDQGKLIARTLAGTAEVGRSILTTPGVPPDRLKALRDAFQEMLHDSALETAAAKRHLMIDPAKGEDMDAITAQTLKLPKKTVAAIKALFAK
jgi:tripartite-type tricarboxylate transporter receptor subunit TctC